MALLRAWHLFSLDAPTLAAVWCLAFAVATGIAVSPWIPLFLALATWIAYVGDRVLDARLVRDDDLLRERHRFYGDLWSRRRGALLTALAAAIVASVYLSVALLPRALLASYVGVALVAIGYFAIVHARGSRLERALPKEAVVGLVFAMATALPTLLASSPDVRPRLLLPIAFLALVAWLNCVCIERWEATTEDRLHPTAHASTRIVSAHLLAVLAAIAVLVLVALVASPTPILRTLAPPLVVSLLALAYLHLRRAHLSPLALRVFADVALLTPVPLLVLARVYR